MKVKMEGWSMVTLGDAYTAPELWAPHLHGKAYGHPRFPDGAEIYTSRVVSSDLEAGVLRTASGTEYTLGEIDPNFRAWLDEHAPEWDIWKVPT